MEAGHFSASNRYAKPWEEAFELSFVLDKLKVADVKRISYPVSK
jgi:hypothetical protein